MTLPITVTIITLNEEKNLARAIESVKAWAGEILVIDSGSTDKTKEIAHSHGARLIENKWQGFGQQKNFAQSQAKYDWILSLDADESCSNELTIEIQKIFNGSEPRERAFEIPRKTFYLGRWIMHGGWYPNHLTRLADRRYARWSEPPVHEEWEVDGPTGVLENPILHFPFEDIREQIATNVRYSWLGSRALVERGKRPSLLKLFFKPFGKFIETYLIKGGFRDGLAGLIISINAAHSVFLKYAYLFEEKLNRANSHH